MGRRLIVEEMTRCEREIKRAHADAAEAWRQLVAVVAPRIRKPEEFAALGTELAMDGEPPAASVRRLMEKFLGEAARVQSLLTELVSLRGQLGSE